MKTKYFLAPHGAAGSKVLIEALRERGCAWKKTTRRCNDGITRYLKIVSKRSLLTLLGSAARGFMPFKNTPQGPVKFGVDDYAKIIQNAIFIDPIARKNLVYRVYVINGFLYYPENLLDSGGECKKKLARRPRMRRKP